MRIDDGLMQPSRGGWISMALVWIKAKSGTAAPVHRSSRARRSRHLDRDGASRRWRCSRIAKHDVRGLEVVAPKLIAGPEVVHLRASRGSPPSRHRCGAGREFEFRRPLDVRPSLHTSDVPLRSSIGGLLVVRPRKPIGGGAPWHRRTGSVCQSSSASSAR
jgi:hypothetical protein